jgi:ferredoxin
MIIVKVVVDEELCIGSGLCTDICPEVFELNGGVSTVRSDVVPPKYEEACLAAAEGCPTGALSVEE